MASVCPSFACVYVVTHNAGISRLAPPAVIEGFRSLVYNSLSFLFPQAVFKLKITHPPIHLSNHHLQFTLPVCWAASITLSSAASGLWGLKLCHLLVSGIFFVKLFLLKAQFYTYRHQLRPSPGDLIPRPWKRRGKTTNVFSLKVLWSHVEDGTNLQMVESEGLEVSISLRLSFCTVRSDALLTKNSPDSQQECQWMFRQVQHLPPSSSTQFMHRGLWSQR